MLMQLPTKLLYSISKSENHYFNIYHLHYKKKLRITLIKYAYNLIILWPPPKLSSLPGTTFDCLVKVIATYHLHYKKKLRMTKTIYNFCICYRSNKLEITIFIC